MTPEEFAENVLHPWANMDDDVVLVEPILSTMDESWGIRFTDGSSLTITITRPGYTPLQVAVESNDPEPLLPE